VKKYRHKFVEARFTLRCPCCIHLFATQTEHKYNKQAQKASTGRQLQDIHNIQIKRKITRNSSGDETANVNFFTTTSHMYYNALRPTQTAQHGVVTVRTQKHQPEAKLQNRTVE